LRASEALTAAAVAAEIHICIQTVSKWRRRFDRRGLDGLLDELRPGQPRKLSDAQIEEVIARAKEQAARRHSLVYPYAGNGHWRQPDRNQPPPLHAPSASWLNLVECRFAPLAKRQLRRGVHRSTKELKAARDSFI
jgi:transposase-like protein